MALRQTNSGAQWTEPKGAGVASAMGEVHFVEEGPTITLEAVRLGRARVGQLVDWHGDRVHYEFVRTATPYVIIDDGGVLKLATSGTPAAIMVDNGTGGLRLSTDLSETEAGAFYMGVRGRIIAARFDAPKLGLMQIGNRIRTFETT